MIEFEKEKWEELKREMMREDKEEMREKREEGKRELETEKVEDLVERYREAVWIGLAYHRGLPALETSRRLEEEENNV